MKKTLLSISLISFSFFSSLAQDFVYPVGQHLVVEVSNFDYETFNIEIETPTNQDIQFKWELVSNTFPSNWDASICDYTSCYVGIPASGTMVAYTATEASNGTHGFVKMNLTTALNNGTGKVEMYVYDINDYNIGDTISWEITSMNSASLDDIYKENLLVYPNPSNEVITIEHKDKNLAEVSVFDLSGQLVFNQKLHDHKVVVGLNSWNRGVYFLQTKLEDGTLIQQKIVLN
jgi:hypothetical protein